MKKNLPTTINGIPEKHKEHDEALDFRIQSEYVDFFLLGCNKMRFPFGMHTMKKQVLFIIIVIITSISLFSIRIQSTHKLRKRTLVKRMKMQRQRLK